jgi:hypothetical protein
VVARVQATQANLTPLLTPGSSNRLTLISTPAIVQYRDLLNMEGVLLGEGAGDQPIDIYVDGEYFVTTDTDASGGYSHKTLIGESKTGDHVLYARIGEVFSPFRNFTIAAGDTDLFLTATEGRIDGNSYGNISGTLTTRGAGVIGAPILLITGDRTYETRTRENGSFSYSLPLTAGTYTFLATFSGSGFPLNPSQSAPVTLVVPAPFPFLSVLVYTGCIGAFILGAFSYLHWQRNRHTILPIAEILEPVSPETAPTIPSFPPAEDTLEKSRLLQAEGKSSEAVYLLYSHLLDQIGERYPIRRMRTLTPREVCRHLTNTSLSGPFAAFVRQYELIHYAGLLPTPETMDRLRSLSREMLTGGDQH